MNTQEKMQLISEILDVDITSINENTVLNDLDEWDSMSRLSVIVMMDDEFGKTISGSDVRNLKTIKDILDMME